MEFIKEFYGELDALNLIIFWGIIIVIILVIILGIIILTKNKKSKKIIEAPKENEIPINILEPEEENKDEINIEPIYEEQKVIEQPQKIEIENNFVAEEHVVNYNNSTPSVDKEEKIKPKSYSEIELPTKPYQRNVLREMSLSQTSPIGINSQKHIENNNLEKAKDLESSLNITDELVVSKEMDNQIVIESTKFESKEPIKEEINLEPISEKTEIIIMPKEEIFDIQIEEEQMSEINKSNSKYLEEVSKKLSEAETPDEIERTKYELEQEENAIISYKELMEKKDSIKTIDEEEAIISIEELMNKSKEKNTTIQKEEDTRLYKLSEEEKNEDFIKELKQFRNDL